MTGDTEGCIDQACVRHATASTTEALRLGENNLQSFQDWKFEAYLGGTVAQLWIFLIDHRIVSAPEISNPISVNAVALCSRESVMP